MSSGGGRDEDLILIVHFEGVLRRTGSLHVLIPVLSVFSHVNVILR